MRFLASETLILGIRASETLILGMGLFFGYKACILGIRAFWGVNIGYKSLWDVYFGVKYKSLRDVYFAKALILGMRASARLIRLLYPK